MVNLHDKISGPFHSLVAAETFGSVRTCKQRPTITRTCSVCSASSLLPGRGSPAQLSPADPSPSAGSRGPVPEPALTPSAPLRVVAQRKTKPAVGRSTPRRCDPGWDALPTLAGSRLLTRRQARSRAARPHAEGRTTRSALPPPDPNDRNAKKRYCSDAGLDPGPHPCEKPGHCVANVPLRQLR
jgi:hypothetical protein